MKLTPGMQQYMDVKNANPDCIVLFRMGDFYETFFSDAKTIARELEITLTSRGKGETRAPLAGIPYHSIDPYIAKLIKKGYKVAIVEQTEDPKKAKGLVKRGLVRIITPGTVVESMILDESSNNYLLSFTREKDNFAFSFCDISTGEFMSGELPREKFMNELRKISPAEIIFPMSMEESEDVKKIKENNFIMHAYDDRFFYNQKAIETLKEHFGVMQMDGFGIKSENRINASGALIDYIKETQKTTLNHINKLKHYRTDNIMYLDSSTIRNLEILKNIMTGKEENTLISVMDKTMTPMGKRKIRKWLTAPLLDPMLIEKRLDAVSELKDNVILREEAKCALEGIYDIERLIGRISYGNANPKDLIALRDSIAMIPKVKSLLSGCKTELLAEIAQIDDVSEGKKMIDEAIKDDPNTTVREGNIIKKGYNKELDELRDISHDAKKYLADLEEREKERSGIRSLKIRYNRIFGYYIEVTNTNLHLVPKDYIRKQTQANAERYITEELKEMESKILGAEERIFELEFELFMQTLDKLKAHINAVQETAEKLAVLDCIVGISEIAQKNNYCRPELTDGEMDIIDGRHPVIEAFGNVSFIPNDCKLDPDERTMIITGPNMAGKSTFMRQNALIVLMAQVGSFVPAKSAKLPIYDRIFTRVGAYDDLVSGQSTFMVEMTEAANILNNATSKSFIVIDEIGRGTSTYDGVSLAWAIAEHLHSKIKAKTLFATHYHHLNKLADFHKGVKNYNIAVDEEEDRIVFLRKIVEGGTDKSYGIQVAKLAGIHNDVIEASKRIMKEIEMEDEIGEMLHKGMKIEGLDKGKDSNLMKFMR